LSLHYRGKISKSLTTVALREDGGAFELRSSERRPS
jgi:hypothetical protein